MIILANPRSDWNVLRPLLFESIGQTLTMVLVTLVIGGFLGLILGVVLYGTRPGNLFENEVVYRILDIIVNIVRPIPFIIFLAAMQPLTIVVVGTSIGTVAAIFPMVVMCTFATSRLVEQNLVPVDPGVIEAARSMGAGKLTIIRTVLIPEALAPLILAKPMQHRRLHARSRRSGHVQHAFHISAGSRGAALHCGRTSVALLSATTKQNNQ